MPIKPNDTLSDAEINRALWKHDLNGDGIVMSREYATATLDMLKNNAPLIANEDGVYKKSLRDIATTLSQSEDFDMTSALMKARATFKGMQTAPTEVANGTAVSPASAASTQAQRSTTLDL